MGGLQQESTGIWTVRAYINGKRVSKSTGTTDRAKAEKFAAKEGDEWRKVFAIGVYTGLRLGDCCRLNWKGVDIVRSIIQLIPSKTKKYAHGRPVTIPIHASLHDILCETPEAKRIGPKVIRLLKRCRTGEAVEARDAEKLIR